MTRRTNDTAGFTLVEVLLAMMITAMVMASVSTTFLTTLEAREDVASMTESTEAGPRILALLERDLQGLWHHGVKNNAVLRGRNMDIAGTPADRIDFLTQTDAIGVVIDGNNTPRRPPVCEVGYWLKRNENTHDLFELWRREDPMVDNDLLTGGEFQLIHDRIKSFDISYYPPLGARAERDVKMEWNSAEEDSLPRRMKIEFTIERRLQSSNRFATEIEEIEGVLKSYVYHLVLDPRYTEILKPGIALMPLAPVEPDEATAGGSAGGGQNSGLAGGNSAFNPNQTGGREGQGGDSTQVRVGRGSGGAQGRGGQSNQFGGRGGGAPPTLPPGIDLGGLLRGGGNAGGGGLFGGNRGGGGGR
jgi:prepilin-type N-terminal cleavage/methylation domain-containing protein